MLTKLIELVKEKYEIDIKGNWCKGSITYFEGLKDEIEEVFEEMKENNLIYLEDELGDVLYDYLNLLKHLEEEGKISSIENVILRSEKKIGERIEALKGKKDNNINPWNEVKKKQKEELKIEHEAKYGKIK